MGQRRVGIAVQILAVQGVLVGLLTVVLYRAIDPPDDVASFVLLTVVVCFVAAMALLGVLLRIRISTPIKRFREDLEVVTRGNLDHKIVGGWNDELSELADGFNELTVQLKRSRDRLREYNRTLERGVEERTHELARRNLELNRAYREKEQAYDELRGTQAQMLQQERMATLGQLLAGIAHEINNPVNFMVNAIRPLETNVGRIQEVLATLTQQYGDVLGEDGGELPAVMDDINASVDLIRKGADRTANIVQNLRTFSRSEGGEFRVTDLTDGLDITLSLLNHTIKGRIEVVRDYDDLPEVECSPGEINQVFMNLLSNACQAIEGPGTIWIRSEERKDGVSLFFQDSGHGISEDDLARIFEPFYTTKEAGIGTGLGLAITSNIIQKHGGRLEVASVPGETTEFEVWLPLRQDPQRWRTGETVLPAADA
ncbi:MAG: histidine kinase [Proteobacteria bacterium]|nr:histidine kinase [Pseudomonadota bacterium]